MSHKIVTATLLCAVLLSTTGCIVTKTSATRVSTETSRDLAMPAKENPYPITYGDVLDISVWGDETMNRRLLVRPDGRISYPLVGDVEVAGMRVPEIEKMLTEKLKEYMPDSPVNVVLFEARGNQVFVVGKVQRPGAFPMPGPLSPVQALAMAGGLTPYASGNSIQIIRILPDGKQKSYLFSYGRIESGTTDQNIQLQPGDTIVVP